MCVCLQYKLREPVRTETGDYLGFTNEGTVGAISFSYTAEGRTLFVGQHAEAMPRIGDEFAFLNRLQANFSVAVQLSTGNLYSRPRSLSRDRSRPKFCGLDLGLEALVSAVFETDQ